jgi:hypothetical protein
MQIKRLRSDEHLGDGSTFYAHLRFGNASIMWYGGPKYRIKD